MDKDLREVGARTWPLPGVMVWAMMLRRVDFPAPFGPSSARSSLLAVREKLSRAMRSPVFLV